MINFDNYITFCVLAANEYGTKKDSGTEVNKRKKFALKVKGELNRRGKIKVKIAEIKELMEADYEAFNVK